MKNNIITIIKKEFVRFFGDKRMVLTTIFMPGIMIYVLYSFMGGALMDQFTTEEDYRYEVYAENLPQDIEAIVKEMPIDVKDASDKDAVEIKAMVEEKETDLYIVFPEDFAEAVLSYDSMTATASAPQIEMYYNSTRTESSEAYYLMTEVFSSYESMLANKFDVNSGEESYDLASKQDEAGQIFSMMLPMLMMMFLFSGCMAIAPESIAGEKERGTIATLLVTPMKRSHLAIGKIISLGVIGLLSGLSSFLGTMLSLPKLMGSDTDSIDASVYQVQDYLLLLGVIMTTVLVIVAVLSLISAFSTSVKEASTWITPLMIVVMVISITSMMGGGAPEETYWYLIPFYNSVQCMNGVFSFSYLPVNIVVTVVANVVYTLVMAVGLAKTFDSEKIMYI